MPNEGEERTMPVISYIEAVNQALREEMERDPRVFVLGEDVGKKGGVFKATQGLYEQFGEDRVIDTPLTESAIVGVAIGAAMYGLRPVGEIQFADFIMPAVNQIISEAARIRYRSNNDWNCPLVIRAPYGGGVHGGLYHSQSVEAVFANQPGLKIVMPSTPYDVKGLLKAAIRDEDPVLFFEHKRAYRLIKGEVPEGDYVLPIGKADVKREGEDITVITYGLCVHFALEAAERLEKEGISVHILDLRTVYPLDKEAVIEAAAKTGKVLLVTEDNKEGSVMSEVAAVIAEHCLFDLDAPVMRLSGPDVPAMPFAPPMEKFFLVNPDKIEKAMRELAEF
jgi:2-oxoisovalerate dehydrogenase E1 component beta subunit